MTAADREPLLEPASRLRAATERLRLTLAAYQDAPDSACLPAGDCVLLGDLRTLLAAAPPWHAVTTLVSCDLLAVAPGDWSRPLRVQLLAPSAEAPFHAQLVFRDVEAGL